MTTKIYHGNIAASSLAKAIATRFSDENLRTRYSVQDKQYLVQIASRAVPRSGGKTSIGVVINQLEDGVSVRIGKQDWLGIAASLGISALTARRNPFGLIGRLDDIAQDIENLSLDDKLWELIDEVADAVNAGQELSEKLKRMACEYCDSANPVGQPRCLACGAPLGHVQPRTCRKCGFVAAPEDLDCTNCGQPLS
jgi:hypothetical protein